MPTPDPKEIFSRRLLQARKMRGLSLRALSEKLEGKVSHSALAKYENGHMLPSSGVLIAIGHALNLNPDYFFRDYAVELAEISYRKRSSLGKKAEESIKEEARDFFERYLELEEILGVREVFEYPLSGDTVSSIDDAERAAIRLRDKWKLGNDALPNIHELLEEKNIKVHEAPDAPTTFDGFSGKADGSCVIVIGKWLDENIPRKRMTLLHELAHVVLNMPADIAKNDEETLAKYFGGAFLIPKEKIGKVFGNNRTRLALQELIEIKAIYGASIKAIVMRAYQLGYLAEAAFKGFCIYYNKQPWRNSGEPGDGAFVGWEKSHRFPMLVHRALAEEQISMSKAAALLGRSMNEVRDEFRVVT